MAELLRIAVTGGPGGGKTSVWKLLAAAHPERVVAVPEVATALFRHVFPQVESEAERCAVQRAIFQVQEQLEAFHAARCRSGQVLLCDRGTPDGAGYWPHGQQHFFEHMQTEWQVELARYDAVLFMESAAVGGLSIKSSNRTRIEDIETASALDQRLKQVWQAHPRFVHVPHHIDFGVKIARARELAETLLK